MRRGNGPKFIAVLEVDGEPSAATRSTGSRATGTIAARTTRCSRSRSSASTPAAERALWQWLFEIDLVGHIKGWRGPVPHPLAARADRAAPARADGPRGPVAADPRHAGRARGADLRRARARHVRADRRLPPGERRSLAARADGPRRATGEWRGHRSPPSTAPGPDPRHERPRVGLPRRVHVRRPGPRRTGSGSAGRAPSPTRTGCSPRPRRPGARRCSDPAGRRRAADRLSRSGTSRSAPHRSTAGSRPRRSSA